MTLNVASLFEAVGAAVPERLALACDARRSSFAELDAQANAPANHRAAGARPHEHVGLSGVVDVVERSPSGKADDRWAKNVLTTQTRRNGG